MGDGPARDCGVFSSMPLLGPTFGVVQNVVAQRRRATATAVLYISLNVFALGGGPLFTGWIIDRFAQADFHSQGVQPAARNAVGASFRTSCPGGAAMASAAAEVKSACNSTLVRATRRGMQVTLLFFLWAAIHYLLASVGHRLGIEGGCVSAKRSPAVGESYGLPAPASSVQSDSI